LGDDVAVIGGKAGDDDQPGYDGAGSEEVRGSTPLGSTISLKSL